MPIDMDEWSDTDQLDPKAKGVLAQLGELHAAQEHNSVAKTLEGDAAVNNVFDKLKHGDNAMRAAAKKFYHGRRNSRRTWQRRGSWIGGPTIVESRDYV